MHMPPHCLPGTQTTPPPPPNPPILLMHRCRPPAPLTPPPPPHTRCRRLLLARRPVVASPRQADNHLQPSTTRLRTHQSARPSKTHPRRSRQEGARAAVQARKGASGKRQSPKARGSRGQGKKKGKGEGSGSGPSQPAVPPGLRGLRAAIAVAAAGREAPAPQRLRMPQGVPPNARQQWAEAYTVTCHKVLDACANAHGAGVRADVLQAVQEFGTLARTVFAYSRGRRSGAAAAARTTRIADGLPLEDAGGGGRWAAASSPIRCAAAGCADRAMPATEAFNPPGSVGAARQQARRHARPAGSCELACSAPGCCAGCAIGGRGAGAAADPRATAGGGYRVCPPSGTAAGPSG